jgi:hypothetical protein
MSEKIVVCKKHITIKELELGRIGGFNYSKKNKKTFLKEC